MSIGLYAPLLGAPLEARSRAATQARPLPPAAAVPATKGKLSPAKDKALHAAAHAFEAMFLNQMFQQMNADEPVDSMFGGGNAEKIYRSMLLDQYAKETSQRSGLGLSGAIYHEMVRMQEKAQGMPGAPVPSLAPVPILTPMVTSEVGS